MIGQIISAGSTSLNLDGGYIDLQCVAENADNKSWPNAIHDCCNLALSCYHYEQLGQNMDIDYCDSDNM